MGMWNEAKLAQPMDRESISLWVQVPPYPPFMQEYFRGVIWPKDPVVENDKTNYRYLIVGLLVTDKPIPEFEGANEICLDGNAYGLSDSLPMIRKTTANYKLGDASSVLTSLGHCFNHEN